MQHLKIVVFLHPQWKRCELFERYCKYRFKYLYLQTQTKWPVRLSARTPGFHPGKRGSIPLRATIKKLRKKQNGKS